MLFPPQTYTTHFYGRRCCVYCVGHYGSTCRHMHQNTFWKAQKKKTLIICWILNLLSITEIFPMCINMFHFYCVEQNKLHDDMVILRLCLTFCSWFDQQWLRDWSDSVISAWPGYVQLWIPETNIKGISLCFIRYRFSLRCTTIAMWIYFGEKLPAKHSCLLTTCISLMLYKPALLFICLYILNKTPCHFRQSLIKGFTFLSFFWSSFILYFRCHSIQGLHMMK